MKLGFNSYEKSLKFTNPIKKSILYNLKNEYEVVFVEHHSYWSGTLLNFTGINGAVFYQFIQKNFIDWNFFSSVTLNRFNLNYSRKNKKTDKGSIQDFSLNAKKKLNKPIKTLVLRKIRKAWF